MATEKYKTSDVRQARDAVISQVKVAKETLINKIESGHRDWAELRKAVERYIDFQSAADVLAGGTVISGE